MIGLVMNIISQLPTSQVAKIVSLLRPRLYLNFFKHFPQEVLLHILEFLDPISLLNTARASREWLSLAMDPRLWREIYLRDGFKVVSSVIKQFEETIDSTSDRPSELQSLKSESNTREPRYCKHMVNQDEDLEMIVNNQHKPSKITFDCSETESSKKLAKQRSFLPISQSNSYSPRNETVKTEQLNLDDTKNSLSPAGSTPLTYMSSLFVPENQGDSVKNKLNWHYLYSQRRRLESNWESEKYVNFQLPDPSHPEEAHLECIYAIHFTGKYLVSGGRDRTIRMWNLDTRRLIRPPLRAHLGSVLCVQFDADPEEDLIVSGSSDCSVIVWKFSTGQVIQKIVKAHKQPVLNVQFDKRIIVTCSKDRTIKIFNRKPFLAGNLDHMVDVTAITSVPTHFMNYGVDPAPSLGLLETPAYSLIGTLDGHSAAVNAIQIHGDEVVSASGDRLVKIWNWPKQICVRTLVGHSKGIACVHYDGRRIVSGSSDNEIKVFDKETAVEVASLRAHTHIVRTIQADFGDLPFSVEKDKAEARAIDLDYFKALDSGMLSTNIHLQRGRPRNAGSRRPEHITAFGAKLPPGGGGGKFGRIVSGSYDGTIIIWRRDKEGVWEPQHRFRYEEALKAAERNSCAQPKAEDFLPQQQYQRLQTTVQQPSEQNSASNLDISNSTMPYPMEGIAYYRRLIDNAVSQGPLVLRNTLAAHPQLLNYETYLRNRFNVYPQDVRQAMETIVTLAYESNQRVVQPQTSINYQPSPQSVIQNSSLPHQDHGILIHPNSIATEVPSTAITNDHNSTHSLNPNRSRSMQNPAAHFGNMPNRNTTNSMSRVFNLQFDARRIICCSQKGIIVGWDFANNDQRLIEASRFFAAIK